ncbi:MAG TPA: hypothetical protein VM582_06835, partial [Candidatus Thermoplasmatota archaeon]|nr:hypothetical protein [Candidatus Thermoplasmatota archaeon]
MDVRDFAIFTHLLAHPFDSFEQVGRLVGMSGVAAKARIQKLREEGFLGGFHCVPAAETVGRRAYGHLFLRRERMTLDDVLAIDGVVTGVEYAEGSLSVISYARDDE